jgi:hypothetical protein
MSWLNVLNIAGWLKGGTTETPVSEAEPLPVSVSNAPAEYPLPAAQVAALKSPPVQDALTAGILFSSGGRVAVTNNTAVLQLLNPVGSNKIVTIQKFFLAAESNVDVQFVKNGTVNTPTTREGFNLNFASSNVAVAQVRTGTTNITGGTSYSSPARLAANITAPFEIPVVLIPGTSISATFVAAGLTALVCFGNVVWTETPI